MPEWLMKLIKLNVLLERLMKLFILGMFLPPEKASALAKLQSLSNSRDVLFQLANTIPNSKHSSQGGTGQIISPPSLCWTST
ncbi:hypothetical protein V6N13_048112 [Hibiscus sabdariffa]